MLSTYPGSERSGYAAGARAALGTVSVSGMHRDQKAAVFAPKSPVGVIRPMLGWNTTHQRPKEAPR